MAVLDQWRDAKLKARWFTHALIRPRGEVVHCYYESFGNLSSLCGLRHIENENHAKEPSENRRCQACERIVNIQIDEERQKRHLRTLTTDKRMKARKEDVQSSVWKSRKEAGLLERVHCYYEYYPDTFHSLCGGNVLKDQFLEDPTSDEWCKGCLAVKGEPGTQCKGRHPNWNSSFGQRFNQIRCTAERALECMRKMEEIEEGGRMSFVTADLLLIFSITQEIQKQSSDLREHFEQAFEQRKTLEEEG